MKMNQFLNSEIIVKKIALACFVKSGTGEPVHSNRPTHGIAFHLDGEKTYRFDNNICLTVKKDDIIFLPKGSNYVVEAISKNAGDCYAINFDVIDENTFEPFVLKGKNSSLYKEAFKNANTTWRLKEFGHQALCMSELYRILHQMQKEYLLDYIPKEKSKIILPAVKYIHSEYANGKIDIPYLANLCGIGQTYFRQIFQLTYGVPPIQYINKLKLERASELLNSNMYSVSDVMTMSGFENESYFCRAFKKAYGKAPVLYKKGISPILCKLQNE